MKYICLDNKMELCYGCDKSGQCLIEQYKTYISACKSKDVIDTLSLWINTNLRSGGYYLKAIELYFPQYQKLLVLL
jgi:hypothetical protein